MSPRSTQPQDDDRLSRTERCSLHQEIAHEDKPLHRLLGDLIHTLEGVEVSVKDLASRMDDLEKAQEASGGIEDRLVARLADFRSSIDSIKGTVESSAKVIADLSSRVG